MPSDKNDKPVIEKDPNAEAVFGEEEVTNPGTREERIKHNQEYVRARREMASNPQKGAGAGAEDPHYHTQQGQTDGYDSYLQAKEKGAFDALGREFNNKLAVFRAAIGKLVVPKDATHRQITILTNLHNEIQTAATTYFSPRIPNDEGRKAQFEKSLMASVDKAKNDPALTKSGFVFLDKFINSIIDWLNKNKKEEDKIKPFISEVKKDVQALDPKAGATGFFEKYNELKKVKAEDENKDEKGQKPNP